MGNTPAYAGKTCFVESPIKSVGKHPRLRGEDIRSSTVDPAGMETPPLTRGRRRKRRALPSSGRNTPAYAGKTGMSFEAWGADWETPPLTRGRLYT